MDAVEFSLSLNNRFAVDYPEYGFEGMVQLAEMVDSSSLEAIWVGDSLFDSPRFEPVATLGVLAEKTDRLTIGTSILQPHLRNRVLIANSVATLDKASDGRMILGVGIGGGTPDGVQQECEEVGIRTGQRAAHLEETVEDVRRIWEGTHAEVELPIKPQQSTVPIWIASGIYQPEREDVSAQSGSREESGGQYIPGNLERVARLADGWFTVQARPEDIRESLRTISSYREEYGREDEDFSSCVECWLRIGPDPDECFDELHSHIKHYFHGAPVDPETVKRWSVWGPPEQCEQQLGEYQDAGVDQVKFKVAARNPRDQVEKLLDSVLA